jgi:hypothetical protein
MYQFAARRIAVSTNPAMVAQIDGINIVFLPFL